MDQQTTPTTEAEATTGFELLDFWAEWCGPCKVMEPVLDEIEKEYKNKLTIKKLNVDEEQNQALVEQYHIMSVPTYIFIKNGEVVSQVIGAQSKDIFTKKIDSLLEEKES